MLETKFDGFSSIGMSIFSGIVVGYIAYILMMLCMIIVASFITNPIVFLLVYVAFMFGYIAFTFSKWFHSCAKFVDRTICKVGGFIKSIFKRK